MISIDIHKDKALIKYKPKVVLGTPMTIVLINGYESESIIVMDNNNILSHSLVSPLITGGVVEVVKRNNVYTGSVIENIGESITILKEDTVVKVFNHDTVIKHSVEEDAILIKSLLVSKY